MNVRMTKSTLRSTALGLAVMLGGALLGLAAAPNGAAAAPLNTYKCANESDCAIGTKTCCEPGGLDGVICSTMCPIIIQ